MKTALRQRLSAGIVAALASPGWALPPTNTNDWQCAMGPACGVDPASQYWINPANWTLGVPPLNGQDVRITPTYQGVSPVNYAELEAGQVLRSLSIDGMTLNHPTFDPAVGGMVPYRLTTDTLTLGGPIGQSNLKAATYNLYDFQVVAVGVPSVQVLGVAPDPATEIAFGMIVGQNGAAATFNQLGSGDVYVSSGALILGKDASASSIEGTYKMGGIGSLFVTTSTIVGMNGNGVFIQDSGTHSAGSLVLGVSPVGTPGTGTYRLNGGTVAVAGATVVGENGLGVFNNNGGKHDVAGDLVLGAQSTGNGTYNLNNPDVGIGKGVFVTGNSVVGDQGTGTFKHDKGTHSTTNLVIARGTGGAGTYTLNDGSLSSGFVGIGFGGTGDFIQNGGSVTASNGVTLGSLGSGKGTYSMSDGSLTIPSDPLNGKYPYLVIGDIGKGTFMQTGGKVSVDSVLVLGQAATGSGTYTLSGTGEVRSGNFIVGASGTGTFTNNGGAQTVNGDAYIGGNTAAATSTYKMNAGGSLKVTGLLAVGDLGTGVFNQTGGAVTATTLTVGRNAGVVGTYDLSGGTLTSGNAFIGRTGKGTLTNGGGTQQVSGNLTLGRDAGASGTYNLNTGGSLSVTGNVIVSANLGGSSTGTLNVSGGGLTAANMNVNAGGRLNYSGGSITLITLGSGAGTLSVAPGGTVNVTGTAASGLDFYGKVDNQGTFKITGTIITWNGKFINGSAYNTDPQKSIFMDDLQITSNGYLVGTGGDIFEMHKGFLNYSTRAADWNTSSAELRFIDGVGAPPHQFGVSGDGATEDEEFKWGKIVAGSGVHLSFFDSTPGTPGMVLWVGVLDFEDHTLDPILLDPGEMLTIHFDPNDPGNKWLIELGYTSGVLRLDKTLPPGVPEPSTLALLGLGLAGLAATRRRRE